MGILGYNDSELYLNAQYQILNNLIIILLNSFILDFKMT